MKKKIAIVIVILLLLAGAAFAALLFLGIIRVGDYETPSERKAVMTAYIKLDDVNIILDEDGITHRQTKENGISDLVQISGIDLMDVTYESEAASNDPEGLRYALKTAGLIREYEISGIREIMVSEDNTITLTIGKAWVLLGEDLNTTEKIRDLSRFYEQFSSMQGTLNMQEYDVNNRGYVFKKEYLGAFGIEENGEYETLRRADTDQLDDLAAETDEPSRDDAEEPGGPGNDG